MHENSSVGVVIPAYNEEGFVGEVIDTLPAFVDRAYVVDDCSTDGTWEEIVQSVAAVDETGSDCRRESAGPVIEPIRHDRNRGVGGAITTGYRRASEDDLDVVAVMNGDGQMDPAILHRIITPVVEGRADYAKGNRLFSRDHVDSMSGWRRLGNGVLTFLTKVASGYWKMMDPQNGYTAISGRALDEIDLDSLYEDYGFCNDVLVRLNAREMHVADVEMEAVYGEEMSTIRYHRFIPGVSKLLLDRFIWRLKVRYLITDFHPLVGLYLIGAVTTVLSALGLTKAALSNLVGRDLPGPTSESSVELLFMGLVSATGAMTLDMKENESLEEQARVSDDGQVAREASADSADGSSPSVTGDHDATDESPTADRPVGERAEETVGDRTDGEIPTSTSGD